MSPDRKKAQIVAAILAGAWRPLPPPLQASAEEVAAVEPFLRETGAEGLAHWRLGRTGAQASSAARRLQRAYRLHTLHEAVQENDLHDLLERLRSAAIEPLIVKGWSVSRLYAEPGLRPSGDIDLCVRPEDMARATTVLTAVAGEHGCVDLHSGVADLDDRPWQELYTRSRVVPLSHRAANATASPGGEVRVLGAEDQLRHLCLHLMRHGAWRPLWLCDVAAALESLPADFDWDYCLSGQRRLADWVICTIGLARSLLDARIAQPEIARRAAAVPHWVAATVLQLWGQGTGGSDEGIAPFTLCLHQWGPLRTALRRRWPNPIRAAFQLRLSPFHRLPRPLMQLAAFLLRSGYFAVHHIRRPNRRVSSKALELHPAADHVW